MKGVVTSLSGCWEPVLTGAGGMAGMSGSKPDKEAAPGFESLSAPGRRAEAQRCRMMRIWTREAAIEKESEGREKMERHLKEEFKFTKDWLKGR